jgi:hypothetical protein
MASEDKDDSDFVISDEEKEEEDASEVDQDEEEEPFFTGLPAGPGRKKRKAVKASRQCKHEGGCEKWATTGGLCIKVRP